MDFLRNKIRIELLPTLALINPRITEVISRSAEVSRLEHGYLSENADMEFKKIISKRNFGLVGMRKKYLSIHKSVRLEVLRRLPI